MSKHIKRIISRPLSVLDDVSAALEQMIRMIKILDPSFSYDINKMINWKRTRVYKIVNSNLTDDEQWSGNGSTAMTIRCKEAVVNCGVAAVNREEAIVHCG